jgi:hypothetical protein
VLLRRCIPGLLMTLTMVLGARADPALPVGGPPQARLATMRTGNHDAFGRVVIDLPPGVTATVVEEPGGVKVTLHGGALAAVAHPPHNVAAITGNGAEVHLALPPGAHFTAARLVAHLVIDVFPPGSARNEAAPAIPPVIARAPDLMASVSPSAPQVAPAAPHGRRFSGPPPRHPMPPPGATPELAAGVLKLPTVITPGSPRVALAMPPPAPPPAPPLSPPAPAVAAAPGLPSGEGAVPGSPESVRVPLQRLLGGGLPTVLRPTPPADAGPPQGKPAAPDEAASDQAADAGAMTAPITDVERAPLPPPRAAAGAEGPLAIAVQGDSASVLLPFAPGTGVAAFRRGGETVVVFDERRPLDLSTLADDPGATSAFGTPQVQLLPAATVLRLALPPGAGLRLTRGDDGWTLTRVARPPALAPIRGDIAGGAMRLAAAAAGTVVSVPDPGTGGALLVGTQTQPGEGVPVERHTPDFTLLETLQGVAVDPVSDALALRVAPAKQFLGFVIETEQGPATVAESGRGVALDPPGPETVAALEAARMTRRWDFPALATEALLHRLQAAADGAAAAPPQGRSAARLVAVQAQLSLGMGSEAQALANLVVADDARAADSPDIAGLTAIAALLAGRVGEADAIADPRLDGTDEVTLWRAVRAAMQREGAPEAAAAFAATTPLLLAYPPALRDRLLPLAAETMVLGGERGPARRLLESRKDDGTLDYARALLAEADGHAAPALAIYDRLAQSPDRLERARAAVRAAELRLSTGAYTAAQAADALDKLIYAWRGDRRELALRLRVAELRDKSGNWRAALAMLRETGAGALGQSWADELPAIRTRMGAAFGEALDGDARAALSPLELVSLVEENADLLPDGEAGRALAARLADRLVALDLPKRAEPVLERLMNATSPGAARAEFGSRLAALRLDQHDPAGALEALSASTAADLPTAVDEARTITFARATAERGALGPATAALAALGTARADEVRASLLERAKDWPGAVAALASFVQKTVPPTGALAEAPAQAVLRLASAAAQADDEALLARLRERELPRMPQGKLADMLRLLTESPVQGVADLPRSAQEAALARDLPATLKAMAPAVPIP